MTASFPAESPAPARLFWRALVWSFCLWGLFAVVSVLVRPLFPVDETRYLTVAWEMHVNRDLVLPTLNFEPYHHKPPLMFWMINLMWSVFGVSRLAASLVPFLFAFGALTAGAALARTLWPEKAERMAALVLILGVGSLPFLVYGTLFLFDYMLTLWVVLAALGIWRFSCDERVLNIVLFGAAVGAGILTKGPVMLLHVLPLVVLAPLWAENWREKGAGWTRWYLWHGAGLAGGVVIALCWAIPAALRGGESYGAMIFWEQSAGRVVQAFDHEHPFWYYFPFVPLFFIPWLFFPSFWRRLRALFDKKAWSQQERFLVCWILPVFMAFCLISGKQVHYLVPLTPALWILMASRFVLPSDSEFPFSFTTFKRAGVALAFTLVAGQAAAGLNLFRPYDLEPLAEAIQPWLGRPIAFVQNWHGEIGFLARMTTPVTSLSEEKSLPQWFADHPDGVAIVRHRQPIDQDRYDILFDMPFKGRRYYSLIALKSAGLSETQNGAEEIR